MDHSGNLIDCAALAAMGALLETKVPKYENKALSAPNFPASFLFQRAFQFAVSKNFRKTILDASDEEEVASDGRFSLPPAMGFRMCISKIGESRITKEEVSNLIDVALQKGKELRSLLL